MESRRSVDYLSSAASTKSSFWESSDVECDSTDTDDLSTEQSGSEIENGDMKAAEITGQSGPDFEPHQLRPRKCSSHAGISSPVARHTTLTMAAGGGDSEDQEEGKIHQVEGEEGDEVPQVEGRGEGMVQVEREREGEGEGKVQRAEVETKGEEEVKEVLKA